MWWVSYSRPTAVTRMLPVTIAVSGLLLPWSLVYGCAADQGGTVALVRVMYRGGDCGPHGRGGSGCRGCVGGDAVGAQFGGRQFVRQRIPAELHVDAVGPGTRHHAPAVDGAGRTGLDARHAQLALDRVDHVVVRAVRDCAGRAGGLAGVAANAGLGVDEVLLDDGGAGADFLHNVLTHVRPGGSL